MATASWSSGYPKENSVIGITRQWFGWDGTNGTTISIGPNQNTFAKISSWGYTGSPQFVACCHGQTSSRPPIQIRQFVITFGTGNYPDEGYLVDLSPLGILSFEVVNPLLLGVSPDGEKVRLFRMVNDITKPWLKTLLMYTDISDMFQEPANDSVSVTGWTIPFTALVTREAT